VVRKSRGGVQLQRLQLGIGLGLWFGNFYLVCYLWKRRTISWLSVGFGTASIIILSVKGYGAWGWLHAYGWVTICDIVYGETITSNILIGNGPTLPLDSLAAGR
jgi:hypothetical protein